MFEFSGEWDFKEIVTVCAFTIIRRRIIMFFQTLFTENSPKEKKSPPPKKCLKSRGVTFKAVLTAEEYAQTHCTKKTFVWIHMTWERVFRKIKSTITSVNINRQMCSFSQNSTHPYGLGPSWKGGLAHFVLSEFTFIVNVFIVVVWKYEQTKWATGIVNDDILS